MQTGGRPYCRWDYYAGRRPLILNALLYDDCLSDIGDGLADNGQLCRDCYDGGSGAGAGVGCADIGAHMFVFYFGIVADITPPVCLATYAGAGIARANPFQSRVTAFKLASAAYIVPYIFVANPQAALIDYEPAKLAISVVTALIGMVGISAP